MTLKTFYPSIHYRFSLDHLTYFQEITPWRKTPKCARLATNRTLPVLLVARNKILWIKLALPWIFFWWVKNEVLKMSVLNSKGTRGDR